MVFPPELSPHFRVYFTLYFASICYQSSMQNLHVHELSKTLNYARFDIEAIYDSVPAVAQCLWLLLLAYL